MPISPKAAAPSAPGSVGAVPAPQAGAPAASQLQFQPPSLSVKPGDTVTVGLAVSNVSDLFSIPMLIHYDPSVIEVEEVRNGGFLSGGTQEIAIVQRIDQEKGEVIVSATRQPNTPGINGSGTLLGIVVKGLAPGKSQLQILQLNARNSQQQAIPMVSGVATVQVQ